MLSHTSGAPHSPEGKADSESGGTLLKRTLTKGCHFTAGSHARSLKKRRTDTINPTIDFNKKNDLLKGQQIDGLF